MWGKAIKNNINKMQREKKQYKLVILLKKKKKNDYKLKICKS